MPDLYFATCPKGTAELLAAELAALGALSPRLHAGGVGFEGDLACAYRVLLWSRVANRLLRVVTSFEARDEQALYAGVRAVDWDTHLAADGTLAVDAVCQRSQLSHSLFVAQRVKDGVVDQMRERHGLRPTVDTHAPDLRLNLYLDCDRAQLAIDLSGASLHQRHYRGPQGAAPLKENLAAAILLRARWGGHRHPRWRPVRPDVRLGHFPHRRRADRSRHRPRSAPRRSGMCALARSRCRAVGQLVDGRASPA